jgi:pimeloyl-ACP methyl ester carboxylesterase
MTKRKSVILVHGAWADGSSWATVISMLLEGGAIPIAVQLPLTRFEDDVAAVQRAIALAEPPVVLVGHSYGGAVITEAGTHENVQALVYVAAFAPDAGESAGSVGQAFPPPPMAAELRPDAAGFLKLTEVGIRENFAQDLTATEKNVLYAAQAPTAIAALGGVISRPAWLIKPSWYLVATSDRAIQPELQRKMAKQINALSLEVDSSHVVMLSHPAVVAQMILHSIAES